MIEALAFESQLNPQPSMLSSLAFHFLAIAGSVLVGIAQNGRFLLRRHCTIAFVAAVVSRIH